MKTMKYVLGAASAAMLAGLIYLPTASAADPAMIGSKHDLKGQITAGTVDICIFCHTPHDTSGEIPLWNKSYSSTTFTMYDSTMSSTVEGAQASAPEGVSQACLSCHDGSIAPTTVNYNGGRTITAMTALTGAPAVGLDGDLSDDHPISIKYDPAADTGGLNTVLSLDGVLTLYDGTNTEQVECGTCHDPHMKTVANGGNAKMLRVANTNSALCVTCHIK